MQTILQESRINQNELARIAKVSRGAVHQWVSGAVKTIRVEYAYNISRALGYDMDWITMGVGHPKGKAPTGQMSATLRPMSPDDVEDLWPTVPIIGEVSLKDDATWCQLVARDGTSAATWPTTDPGAYAVWNKGDGARPRVRNDEIIIAEPNVPIENGDEVVIRGQSEKLMLALYLYTRQSQVFFISVNENQPPFSLDQWTVTSMDRVAGHLRPIGKATAAGYREIED
ncbi:XRE family transcriptional regulator [Burkholderia gladioli]|uniref:XRE family transcriptional regulator n=1 Tax=Burkholderia gladioli TaxID=28095 RepID=UPI0034DB6879